MLNLHNTLTGVVEPVVPHDGRLSLYVCGVTPYDTTHLGHAFTYVMFDVLVRYLKNRGVDVRYTQNVTDIDDDILRKAKELEVPFDELARRETAQFLADMRALNVDEPDSFVPATTVIDDIVASVQQLIDSGHAYVGDGNVYFANQSFPGYGAPYTERPQMLELAAEHGGNPGDMNKRDPLDFLLWQKHLEGEPAWPSPFGDGRPGWHIECTAIALSELGSPIDIHGGGTDLIFPHHASERAQAESLNGRPFVRHWMHTAMVMMDGEKMSKSLGNMVFVRDLVRQYSADAIRLYLLSHHYRDSFEWDPEGLEVMGRLADRMREAKAYSPSPPAPDSPLTRSLTMSMENDFRTDEVMGRLLDLVESGSTRELADVVAWAAPVLGLTFEHSLHAPSAVA